MIKGREVIDPMRRRTWVLAVLACFVMSSAGWAAADGSLRVRASALVGFDNNTNFDSDRKSDWFGEETVSLNYRKQTSEFLRFRLSSNLLNVNYFEATDENIFLPSAAAGIDVVVAPKTVLETDYNFSYTDFPNDNSISSYDHDGRVGLKRVLTRDLILRAGIGASAQNFTDWKLREADGIPSSSKERDDLRYTVDSSPNFYLSEVALLIFGFNYYWNDSNDLFHDYYDYEGFKFFTGVSVKFSQKISGFARFGYERRDYDSRPLLNDAAVFENDDFYTGTGGLFYKFNNHVSLGALYSYRQKNSNEPSEKYSDSISTLGFYYSF